MPAVPDSIRSAIAFVEEELAAMECPAKAQTQLSIATDEIIGNIVHYAYSMGIGSVSVRIEALDEPRGARITFMDMGVVFNPLEAREPDIKPGAGEQRTEGLGIYLANKMLSLGVRDI